MADYVFRLLLMDVSVLVRVLMAAYYRFYCGSLRMSDQSFTLLLVLVTLIPSFCSETGLPS